jgi:hypothetical protein
MVVTSYGTYRELRGEGLSGKRIVEHLQSAAKRLLLR